MSEHGVSYQGLISLETWPWQASFEEHHYLKQGLPLMWGLLVRDEEQCLAYNLKRTLHFTAFLSQPAFGQPVHQAMTLRIPVGFHAIAWQTGCGAPREARVVILPEYQGEGCVCF